MKAKNREDSPKENACQICGRDNPVWFAPNEIWNRVFPERVGFLCPICFIERADPIIPHTGWMLTPEYLDGGEASLICQLDIKLSQTLFEVERLKAQLEASRRDALEEARKAICYHCRMGIPVDPLSESLVLWHKDTNSGRLDICQATAIRALKEKGPK